MEDSGVPRAMPWDHQSLCTFRVLSNLDSSLKGQYQVTVEAQDKEEPVHTAQTVLNVSVTPAQGPPALCSVLLTPALSMQIFTVDQSHRIRLQFLVTADEVQSNSEDIKR